MGLEKKLEGITINGTNHKISQFADDTTACWIQADLVVALAPDVSSALPAVGTPKCLPAEERMEDVGRVSSARGCEFVLDV